MKRTLPFTRPKAKETATSSKSSASLAGQPLDLESLKSCVEMWLIDCEIRRHSETTLANRKLFCEKLVWFHEHKKFKECNRHSLSAFFLYIANGHQEPGGRWGNPALTKPSSPGTSATYHRVLRAFFNWIVKEGTLQQSPMEAIAAPIDRPDDVVPFTDREVELLFAAAEKTAHPKRDKAILMFLLDSGARISEICGLKRGDIDVKSRSASVEGKGGKRRQIYVSAATFRALWQYLQEEEFDALDAVFRADRGTRAGDALSRSGMQQLIQRIAAIAGVKRTRCSPHTFRHTFAIMYLRPKNGKAGGSQLSLMQILGHTNVKMTQRYVHLAQADVAQEHRINSPVEQIKRRK